MAEKELGVWSWQGRSKGVLPQELLEVDLADPLQGAEGQGGRPLPVSSQVELGVVLRAQDDGPLEEHGQEVDVVEGEVEHDPPGHE